MKFNGNWKGKGKIIKLNTLNNQTSTDKVMILLNIKEESDNIFLLTGKVVDKQNNIISFAIIGYYNPNTKCIETSEKSGNGITTTFFKSKKLYHRASISNSLENPNINFAASFKLVKA